MSGWDGFEDALQPGDADGDWGEFEEEGRGEGLVFVDEFAEVKDPVAISGQRMKWLLAVAKTLRQYYEGSLKTDTPGPGKVNSEAAVETAKRELAATMLQSIYMDYEKREKVDKKAADEKAAKQEGKGEDDALPAGGTGAVASAPSQSTTLRRQASSTGGQAAKEPGATPLRTASCIVCMEAFAGGVEPYKLSNCGHACVCAGCLTSMLNVKIDSRDVLPWIFCPAPNCKVAIHASDISSLVKAWPMYAMIQVYIHKLLARDNRWTPCHNYQGSQAVDDSLAASSAIKPVFKCYYGFYLKDETEVREETCQVCSLKQTVKRSEALDEHFQRMVKEGTLRGCPKCKHWTLKEKGICNVINCANCSIWWNWRTKATGTSSADLKSQARSDGSLWEPGELEYQQQLQHTDMKAFKALLERNGMEYDPNYMRGT